MPPAASCRGGGGRSARGSAKGVPADLCEALWRQMIGWFVQYEEEKLRISLEGKGGG